MTDQRDSPWQELGARIREARKEAGLTQKRLGELVGVDPHTVWYWEAGRMKPNHANLAEVAFHTQASVAELEGRVVVEAELRKEAELSFRDAIVGLPLEDVESIQNYIRFVKAERRRRARKQPPG